MKLLLIGLICITGTLLSSSEAKAESEEINGKFCKTTTEQEEFWIHICEECCYYVNGELKTCITKCHVLKGL